MATKQLSDGNPDGTVLGQSSADLISLYGATATSQAATIADFASIVVSESAVSVQNTAINAMVTKLNILLDDLSDIGVHASA